MKAEPILLKRAATVQALLDFSFFCKSFLCNIYCILNNIYFSWEIDPAMTYKVVLAMVLKVDHPLA